jgi:methylmalonyl-CoA mutase N-terminal domain/subunit
MRERFGAKEPRSWMLRFHTQTGGSTLTAQQIDNNIVRVTLQAVAAVLGGTQSLHTNARDEALALPTAESARIALRTQQIIAHESGVADTVDPLAGSYYIESLTNEIEDAAAAYIAKIDELGGAVAAIEQGYVQGEIQEAAYRYQQAVERGDEIIVGVNQFSVDEAPPANLHTVDPAVQAEQVQRLRALRERRDNGAVAARLADLKQAAAGSDNLLPHILAAVRVYATTGEICGALREVFGEYTPPEVL